MHGSARRLRSSRSSSTVESSGDLETPRRAPMWLRSTAVPRTEGRAGSLTLTSGAFTRRRRPWSRRCTPARTTGACAWTPSLSGCSTIQRLTATGCPTRPRRRYLATSTRRLTTPPSSSAHSGSRVGRGRPTPPWHESRCPQTESISVARDSGCTERTSRTAIRPSMRRSAASNRSSTCRCWMRAPMRSPFAPR